MEIDDKDNRGFDFFNKVSIFSEKYKVTLVLGLLGLSLLGVGVFLTRSNLDDQSSKVEIINTDEPKEVAEIFVEIAGSVEKPGVYKMKGGSRIGDLIIASGGISAGADREWVEMYINKAAKLNDGQKIYIPSFDSARDEQSDVLSANKNSGSLDTPLGFGKLMNINIASQKELEDLPGIGPVYAQNIIEHRPYSTVEELLSRSVLKRNVYEKIKDRISVY